MRESFERFFLCDLQTTNLYFEFDSSICTNGKINMKTMKKWETVQGFTLPIIMIINRFSLRRNLAFGRKLTKMVFVNFFCGESFEVK